MGYYPITVVDLSSGEFLESISTFVLSPDGILDSESTRGSCPPAWVTGSTPPIRRSSPSYKMSLLPQMESFKLEFLPKGLGAEIFTPQPRRKEEAS